MIRDKATSLVKNHGASIVMWTCYGITALSIIVRIIMYCKGRSLWVDEAMLAESIITRSFASLLAAPLVNNQTAPALYLYVVKLFGALTGYSEGGLRIFSFFMFLGMLPLEYLLLTRVFKTSKLWTAFAICATATFGRYFRYSNELKPYMGDAFFVICVLWLYHVYTAKKIKLPVLVTGYCIIFLFSTPSLFFIASVFICEFVFAVLAKDKGRIIKTFCAGAIVLVFSLAYYVWWLMPVAESDVMVDFWKSARFTFWPLTKITLKSDARNFAFLLGMGALYFPFACIGFIVSIMRKDKLTFIVGLSLLLLLVASSIEKYPMTFRLWLFIYALDIIYMAVCFNFVKGVLLEFGSLPLKRFFSCLAIVLFLLNIAFVRSTGGAFYLDTEEANPLITYVQKNITDNEHLYVYANATSIVKYKNGYDTNKIGNVGKDNIIWGRNGDEWTESNQNNAVNEFNKIIAAQRAYLIFYHTGPQGGEPVDKGLTTLSTLGYLHKVGEFHETPLYYFTTDPADPKRNETHDFGR